MAILARSLVLTAAVAGLLRGSPALAWNDRGHMIVAALAYDRLDPAVRDRVDSLLRLNPQHASWVRGVARSRASEVAFLRASTWPDFIKRPAAGYTDDGNRPSGPQASQNIGYADRLQHRYWHYIDLPFSTDGTPLEDPVAPNAETQIEAFRAALRAPGTSDDVRSYDLAWLLHLVGDVHQPLHATSRFSAAFPHGDQGGNKVKVTCSPSCQRDLHAFWDDVLGRSTSPTAAIAAARKLATPPAPSTDLTTDAWIRESLALAQSTVYAAPVGDGAGPYLLTAAYRAAARAAATKQVQLAGARLAGVLNEALR